MSSRVGSVVAGGSVSGGESSAGIGAPEQANANANRPTISRKALCNENTVRPVVISQAHVVYVAALPNSLESGSLRCSTSITLTLWGSRKCRSRKAAQNRFESVTYSSTLFS